MSLIENRLLDLIADQADEIERQGRIPETLVREMKAANCFSLMLPARHGGRELAYPNFLEVVESIARADGSAGWCVNQGSVLSSLAFQMTETAVKKIWPEPGCSVANGPPARCEAVEAPGGYSLTGRWSFSSGIAHAEYLGGVAPVKRGSGKSDVFWFFFPKARARISERWNVNGLKGTASFEFSVEDLVIPEDMAFRYRVSPGNPPLYRIPMNLLFACGFAAVALGVSRGALDFAIGRTREKIKRFDKVTLRENESVQSQIGRAETLWRSAKSFLHTSARMVWQALDEGEDLSDEHRIALRMAGTHVILQSKDVTDIAYAVCSTDSIFSDNEIQRRFQDIHVITQHLQGRTEIYALLGRYFLGLPFEHHMIN